MGRRLAGGGLAAVFAALFLIFAICGTAWGERHTDYSYEQDWAPPSPPANRSELSCGFFSLSNTSCALLGLAPEANRDQILFALIRKNNPAESQYWTGFWNTKLPIYKYYEEAGDGRIGNNGSLRNVWMRLIDISPSVFDPRDNYTYVPRQAYLNMKSNAEMVVRTGGQAACAQTFDIRGYDEELKWSLGNYVSGRPVFPADILLSEGAKANVTFRMYAKADYDAQFSTRMNKSVCDAFNTCEVMEVCANATGETHNETVSLEYVVPVKRYPDTFEYENTIMVPKKGYAQGSAKITLPSDFLYYELRVKGQVLRVQRNDLKYTMRGDRYPVLGLALQPADSRQSSLRLTYSKENDSSGIYTHELRYRLYVENPDVSQNDCSFVVQTPFATKTVDRACEPTVVEPKIVAEYQPAGISGATVSAVVTDPLGQPIEGAEVVFSGGVPETRRTTDAGGTATMNVQRRESTYTIIATVQGGQDVAGAQSAVYIAGIGAGNAPDRITIPSIFTDAAPILILVVIVSAVLAVIMKRRSEWVLLAALVVPLLLAGIAHGADTDSAATIVPAQGALGTGLQATIDACKTYDFDNAVRHFGECAEAYRLQTEFESMRATVATLIANIAPLVVANPDIAPYKEAYASMSRIALSLFRVAWAFNSLYLILNVFNPTKRSAAIKQYVWLIVFIIFVYMSYFLMEDALTLVNVLSTYVAGPGAAQTLMQSKMSVEFISENYEMLKLILPFLNLTYLVLLARYILVIGTLLFFPFTLLLFFTSATRGFGQAGITVTFATIGLGILNSVLMLIYNILSQSADPLLSSSFSTTFFSASFLIFFGFVNLLALAIAFLSGIVFVGQNKLETT